MKSLLFVTLLLIPSLTFANVPDFPMAFWGSATIDGVIAPTGAIVRVYDGTLKVGEAIVQSSGVYGYTEPTKQKLVVGEAENELTFTIQTNGINEGVETKGVNPITHPSFVSGDTVNKNLAFNTKTTTITPPTSGGGGGGGGSRKSKVTTPAAEPLVLGQTSTSTGTEEEQRIQLQKQLIALLTQIIALLQLKMAL